MAQDKKLETPAGSEQRGVVTDVVVPLVSAGVSGAVGAAVSNAIQNRKEKGK